MLGALTDRPDPPVVGAQLVIHQDAPLHRKPGPLCEGNLRLHPGRDDDHVRGEERAVVEHHTAARGHTVAVQPGSVLHRGAGQS